MKIQFFVEEEDVSKAVASRKKYTRLFRKSKNRKSLEQDNDDYADDFATTDSDDDDPNMSAQDTTFDSSFKKFKSK